MVVYTGKLYNHKIAWKDFGSLCADIAILAIFYTFFGALVSYGFYYLFDEYGPEDDPPRGKDWEKHSIWYQLYDICFEIALIALVSFWVTFNINTRAPIFPVPSHLAAYVDTYSTGMFFMFTIFLFMDDLSSKLKFVYNKILGDHFDWIFPNTGSILNLSLRYDKTKTNHTKYTHSTT